MGDFDFFRNRKKCSIQDSAKIIPSLSKLIREHPGRLDVLKRYASAVEAALKNPSRFHIKLLIGYS
jgi:hypothetical protein